MTGRLEQENKLKQNIEERLANLPIIFTQFYQYMESENKSYGTCLHYICYVSDFMEAVTQGKGDEEFYKNVTVSEIRNYIITLRRREKRGQEIRNSDSIQATRWSAINSFYNFLVMDEYIEVNPMNKTKRPQNKSSKEIVYLEKDEIEQIINKIKKEAKDTLVNRDIAIVTLGISTGLRVAALVNVNVGDIDFKANTIHVIEKGNKDRYVKFGNNTRAILSQWIMDRNSYFDDAETDALFISQFRTRITTEGVRKVLRKYTKGLDKHITPHCLRKTAATQAYMSGADIRTIASMLNHNSINTTMRYAAAVDSKKEEMMESLDNLF